jgi:3-hydroxyisobutyrate dehydrogenase
VSGAENVPAAGQRVGFIGLGAMGWHMAGHLVHAGFGVVGLDADPAVAERFATEHGLSAPTPEDFGSVSAIVTMLPTSAIVAEALLGESSVVRDFLASGQLVLDMSTSQPIETRALGVRLAERGIRFVDAPVSGGTAGAVAGALTIMLGADSDADADAAIAVLEPMSGKIFRIGGLGAGHALKALNNFVAGAGFAAACEALLVAKSYGINPTTFVDVLNVSTGRNFSTEKVLPNAVISETWNSGFALALLTKDVGIAADLARGLGREAVIADAVVAQLERARDGLPKGADHSEAIKFWGEQRV